MIRNTGNNRYCVDPYLIRSSLNHQRCDEVTLIRLELVNESDKMKEVCLFRTTYISHESPRVFIPMIHADNIMVVFSKKDKRRTVIPARSVHRCLLYFPRLSAELEILQLVELIEEDEEETIGLFQTEIERQENAIYNLSINLKDWVSGNRMK